MSALGPFDKVIALIPGLVPIFPSQDKQLICNAELQSLLDGVRYANSDEERAGHLRSAYWYLLLATEDSKDAMSKEFIAALEDMTGFLIHQKARAETIASLQEDLDLFRSWLEMDKEAESSPPALVTNSNNTYQDQNPSGMTSCHGGTTMDAQPQPMAVELTTQVALRIRALPRHHTAKVTITLAELNQTFTGEVADADVVKSVDAGNVTSITTVISGEQKCVGVATPGSLKLPSTSGAIVVDLQPIPCYLSCTSGFSLPLKTGCITGFELLRFVHMSLSAFMEDAAQKPANWPQDGHVDHGAHWLLLAGQLQELNKTMIGISCDPARIGKLQANKHWLPPKGKVTVGQHRAEVVNVGNLPRHPRIKYGNQSDLAYSKIPEALMHEGIGEPRRAAELIHLLATGGIGRQRTAEQIARDAAFLVHVFGVEANKNNLTYATALMALRLVSGEVINFVELLHDFDSGNVYGLKGSGGLLGMASYKATVTDVSLDGTIDEKQVNASLGAIQSILQIDTLSNCGHCMGRLQQMPGASRNHHQHMVIAAKEILTIVRWCGMVVPGHNGMTVQEALPLIATAIQSLLANAYRDL